jgi:hypothetical protein
VLVSAPAAPVGISGDWLIVAAVLRLNAYRSLSEDAVWRHALPRGPSRRKVRHVLEQLVARGVVVEDAHGYGFRWAEDPEPGLVARLDATARELAGVGLPPLGGPPARCPLGHDLDPADRWPDGLVGCRVCAGSIDGSAARPVYEVRHLTADDALGQALARGSDPERRVWVTR